MMIMQIGFNVFKQKKTKNPTDIGDKSFEFRFHFFFLVLTLEGRESNNEKDMWTKIKPKINSSISIDDKHIEELWFLLELFQDIFAWHRGELGHSTIGEHTINM